MPIQRDPDGSNAPPRSKRAKVAPNRTETPPMEEQIQELDAQDHEQGEGVQETNEAVHEVEAAPLPEVDRMTPTPKPTKTWTSKKMLGYMRNRQKTSARKSSKSAKLSHNTAPSLTQIKINNYIKCFKPFGEPRGQEGSDASKPGPK